MMTPQHQAIARAMNRGGCATLALLDIARALEADPAFNRPAFLQTAVSEMWFTDESFRLRWIAENADRVTTPPAKSEAEKRGEIIRWAVEYAVEEGSGFSQSAFDENKGKTLEEIVSAYTDSLVDCAWGDAGPRPEGQELAGLVEAVTLGSAILGVDYLSALPGPATAPAKPPMGRITKGASHDEH